MAQVKMYTTLICPFCIRAKMLLKQRGVQQIEEIRVDLNPAERDVMIDKTGRRTVPQIFIGDTHVGGCDAWHPCCRPPDFKPGQAPGGPSQGLAHNPVTARSAPPAGFCLTLR
jgi:glutaredoxin 3